MYTSNTHTSDRTHAHTSIHTPVAEHMAEHWLGTTLTNKLALGVKSNTLDVVWLPKVSHSKHLPAQSTQPQYQCIGHSLSALARCMQYEKLLDCERQGTRLDSSLCPLSLTCLCSPRASVCRSNFPPAAEAQRGEQPRHALLRLTHETAPEEEHSKTKTAGSLTYQTVKQVCFSHLLYCRWL